VKQQDVGTGKGDVMVVYGVGMFSELLMVAVGDLVIIGFVFAGLGLLFWPLTRLTMLLMLGERCLCAGSAKAYQIAHRV